MAAGAELRGFIALAANDSLADDDWLDPVAVRVARAGLASWTDDHLTVFRSGCRKLAGSLDRLSHLYHASARDSEVRLVTITTQDGDEKRMLAQMTAPVRTTAAALAAAAIRAADRELGPGGGCALLAALTEALCTPGEAVRSDYDQPATAPLQRATAAQPDHDSAR